MNTDDTIVAISTPAGCGGLGVVRLSGLKAVSITQAVLRRRMAETERNSELDDEEHSEIVSRSLSLTPRRVVYAELPDERGSFVDAVLVTYFPRPRSYTAEDVVEISCHGSPVVLQFLVGRCLDAGARLAEPGEFTMRAFLNGRIDLTQAEAVRDLIEARTLYQAKIAAGQMEGAVSHRLSPVKKQLVDLISLLEAGIDFAEDDVSVLANDQIAARIAPVQDELERLSKSFSTGRIIQQGLTLAIVGRPNVGKSSLFNCLLQQDRAIVTATPGTTRDLVAESVDIDGVPLRFVDTAGVRDAVDEAESIGVRKSYEASADSDLTLLVLNGAERLMPEDRDLLRRIYNQGKLLIVINKNDLPQQLQRDELQAGLAGIASDAANGMEAGSFPIVVISALLKEGIDELKHAIVQAAIPGLGPDRESGYLTNIRQENLISGALQALAAARETLDAGVPHEMLLLDLYRALRPLDAVTGATTIEDILGNIFSTFCIGK